MSKWSVKRNKLFLVKLRLSGEPVPHVQTFPSYWQQPLLNQWKENDCKKYFTTNLHESMGSGWDQTHDPKISKIKLTTNCHTRPGYINAMFGVHSNGLCNKIMLKWAVSQITDK